MTDKKKAASQEVATLPEPKHPMQAEVLLSQAIEKGVSVDIMERLMAMRRELKTEQAKEAYDAAMARFQAACPTIQKTKKVMERNSQKVRYQYAPIESIVEQTKGLIQENGFSYSVDTKVDEKWVEAICRITHELGHSEVSSFKVPIDPASYMNEAQKFASALTFAKRYAFCNAFGILTGDEDDDSIASGKEAEVPRGTPPARTLPAFKAPIVPAGNDEAAENLRKAGTRTFIGRELTRLGKNEEWIAEKVGKPMNQLSLAGLEKVLDQLKKIPTPTPAAEPSITHEATCASLNGGECNCIYTVNS